MSARPYLAGAAVFALAMVLLLPGLGIPEISSRAEARIPLVALDIVRTGRVFPPYLLGEPYLNKPPLHHLLAAGAIALFGRHDEGTVRLPSVLCGALAVWLTWLLVGRLAGSRAGLVAAAFLFLSYRFFSLARSTQLEILLTAGTTMAYLGLSRVLQVGPAKAGGPGLSGWWIAAAGVAIACLAKGPVIALLFLAFFLAADAIVRRSWRRFASVGPLILLLGAIIGTGVYYGPLIVKFGGVRALLDRLAFENVLHAHGFHYYLWQLPLGLLPAGLALPWMVLALRRPDPIPRTCALAVAIGVVAFSLSPSKQSHYLLPLYPLVAVWAGASGVFARWRAKAIAVAAAVFVIAATSYEVLGAAGSSDGTPASVMCDFGFQARGRPLAMMERHPVLAYYLDRPDLEFVEGAEAAVRFLDGRGGAVVVDLEKGEDLPATLKGHEALQGEAAGHTYLLLLPPKKTDTRR